MRVYYLPKVAQIACAWLVLYLILARDNLCGHFTDNLGHDARYDSECQRTVYDMLFGYTQEPSLTTVSRSINTTVERLTAPMGHAFADEKTPELQAEIDVAPADEPKDSTKENSKDADDSKKSEEIEEIPVETEEAARKKRSSESRVLPVDEDVIMDQGVVRMKVRKSLPDEIPKEDPKNSILDRLRKALSEVPSTPAPPKVKVEPTTTAEPSTQEETTPKTSEAPTTTQEATSTEGEKLIKKAVEEVVVADTTVPAEDAGSDDSKSAAEASILPKELVENLIEAGRNIMKKEEAPAAEKEVKAQYPERNWKQVASSNRLTFRTQACMKLSPGDVFGWDRSFLSARLRELRTPVVFLIISIFALCINMMQVFTSFAEPKQFSAVMNNLLHVLLWGISGIALALFESGWENNWSKNSNFLPEYPTEWRVAMLICFVMVFIFVLETYFYELLHYNLYTEKSAGAYKFVNPSESGYKCSMLQEQIDGQSLQSVA